MSTINQMPSFLSTNVIECYTFKRNRRPEFEFKIKLHVNNYTTIGFEVNNNRLQLQSQTTIGGANRQTFNFIPINAIFFMDAKYKSYQAYVYQHDDTQFFYLFNGGVYLASSSWRVPTMPMQLNDTNQPLYSESTVYYNTQINYNNRIHHLLETDLLGVRDEPPTQRRRLKSPTVSSVTPVTSVLPVVTAPSDSSVSTVSSISSVTTLLQSDINNQDSDTDTDTSVQIIAPATPVAVTVASNGDDGVTVVPDTPIPIQNSNFVSQPPLNLNCEICNAPPNSGCFYCVNCRDSARATGITPCGHPICMDCYTYMRNLTVVNSNRHIIANIPYNQVYDRQHMSSTASITCLRCSQCRSWHTVASYYRNAPDA
jgi:hypothetical protein